MTLKYRLFGKPGNLNEFIEKAKLDNDTRVDISYRIIDECNILATKIRLGREVIAKSDSSTLVVARVWESDKPEPPWSEVAEVYKRAIDYCVATMEFFKNLGMKVTYTGKSLSWLKKDRHRNPYLSFLQ